jgi:hypothetical protein
MNSMKRKVCTLILSTSLILGAAITPKKAEAGVIVAAASSLYVTIPALAIAGMIGGFGTAVGSIYYAIDHRDQSWWAYAFFMLDTDLKSDDVKRRIEHRYPGLDSALVGEIAARVTAKAAQVGFNEQGIKDVVLSEAELQPVLDLLAETDPVLGAALKQDLTQATLLK